MTPRCPAIGSYASWSVRGCLGNCACSGWYQLAMLQRAMQHHFFLHAHYFMHVAFANIIKFSFSKASRIRQLGCLPVPNAIQTPRLPARTQASHIPSSFRFPRRTPGPQTKQNTPAAMPPALVINREILIANRRRKAGSQEPGLDLPSEGLRTRS